MNVIDEPEDDLMKTLPSKCFPSCEFSQDSDAGFYDIIPQGYEHVVSLYLGKETVKNDDAIENAGAFFDKVHEWDVFCRNFLSAEKDSEDAEMIAEYFSFYKDEVPEVFDSSDVSVLTLSDMVNCLKLSHMGTHGSGKDQQFNVDFTLGYDQLLCVYFDSNSEFDHIAWES